MFVPTTYYTQTRSSSDKFLPSSPDFKDVMHFKKARNPYTLHVLCGTSTKVAAGALGFRVQFDNRPEGVHACRGQVR